jgi:hypothetical protein
MSTIKKIAIAIGLILLIVVISLAVEASLKTTVTIRGATLDFNYLNPPSGPTPFVGWAGRTNQYLNITWNGNGGDKFNETVNVPNYYPSTQQILSVGIGVDQPGFSVVSISPKPPITVTPGTYVTIEFTTQSPHANFYGHITFVISCS